MEELVGLLGEELCQKVLSKLGEKKLIIDDGKLIPKHRFDCINISLKEHKEQLRIINQNRLCEKSVQEEVSVIREQFRQLETENACLAQMVDILLPYKLKALKEEL